VGELVNLPLVKPEAEVVAEIKRDLTALLLQVCKRIDQTQTSGFCIHFQIEKESLLGKNFVARLDVLKVC
jgi:hypothetical protein